MARRKKTPEEKAEEQRRYALARAARTDAELEAFLGDPNQAIREAAAANPACSAAVLDRFASDPFWGVRVTVARHANTARTTLLTLVSGGEKQRGVVYAEARRRLEVDGVPFDSRGFAVDLG